MRDMFTNYQNTVIGPVPDENIDHNYSWYVDCLNVVGYGATIFIVINLYYLISDLMRGFYYTPYGGLNCVAIVLMLVPSIYIVVLKYSLRNQIMARLIRFSLLAYYLCIIVSVALFAYTSNVRALAAGADIEFVGITLSSLYLLLMAFKPLPEIIDSIIVLLAMMLGMTVLFFLPGHEMFSFIKQFSLRLIVVLMYIYLYSKTKELSARQKSIHDLNRQLLYSSFVDNLTGSLNRHALDQYIHKIIEDESVTSLGIIMFDIDDFKLFNDKYSHSEGDYVLAAISNTLLSTLGEKDPFCFRFGGEEFIIPIVNANDGVLLETARKYRQAVATIGTNHHGVTYDSPITVSLGCAILAFNEKHQLNDFVSPADAQLYFAKRNGKNCIALRDTIYR